MRFKGFLLATLLLLHISAQSRTYTIYYTSDGTPETGLSPDIDVCIKVSDGTDSGSTPTVSELGGGWYKFTTTPATAYVIRVDSGDAAMIDYDRYKWVTVRPEDDRLDAAISDVTAAGSGAIAHTYQVTSSVDASPIDGVSVWVTTDAAGTNTVASGTTDSFGNVTFYLDAGTYYFWSQKAGYNFTNPDTEVVSE